MDPMKQIEKDKRRFPDHGNPLSGPHFHQITGFELIMKNYQHVKLSRNGMNLMKKHVREMLLSSEQCKCVPINGRKCMWKDKSIFKENELQTCVNFEIGFECDETCGQREGVICMNQCLAKGIWKKLILVPRYDSGAGVAAAEPIKPGDLICEYIGVIYMHFDNPDHKDSHYAFMLISHKDLLKAVVLEPLRMGHINRFVNHSENPNCVAKVLVVDDELRMGFYATKYISVGGDILIDYGPDFKKLLATECKCGDVEYCVHGINYWDIKTKNIVTNCENNVDTSMAIPSSSQSPTTTDNSSQGTRTLNPASDANDAIQVADQEDNGTPIINSPHQHDPNTPQRTTPDSLGADPIHVTQEENPSSQSPPIINSPHGNDSNIPQTTTSSDAMEGIEEADNPSPNINSPRRNHSNTPLRTSPTSPIQPDTMEGIQEGDNPSPIRITPRRDDAHTPRRTNQSSPLSDAMEGIQEADNPSSNINSPQHDHHAIISQQTSPSSPMQINQDDDNNASQSSQTTDIVLGTPRRADGIASPPTLPSTPVAQDNDDCATDISLENSPPRNNTNTTHHTSSSTPSPTITPTDGITSNELQSPRTENIFQWDLDYLASPRHVSSPSPNANTTTPEVIPEAIPCSSNSLLPSGVQVVTSSGHEASRDGVYFFIPSDLLGENMRVTVELESSSPDRTTDQSPRRIQGPSSTFPVPSTTESSTRRILSLAEENPNVAVSVVGKRKIFKFNPNAIKSTPAGSTKKMSAPKKKTSKPEKRDRLSGETESNLNKKSKTNVTNRNNSETVSSTDDDDCIVLEAPPATKTKPKGKKPLVVRLPKVIPTSKPGTSKLSTANKNATSQTPGASITPVSGTGSQTRENNDSDDDDDEDDCMSWEPNPMVPVVAVPLVPSQTNVPPPSIPGPSHAYVPPPSIPGPSHAYVPPPSIPGPSRAYVPPPSIPGPSHVYQPPPSVPGPSHASNPPPPSVPGPSRSNTRVQKGVPKTKNRKILENLTAEQKKAVVLDIVNKLDNQRVLVVPANVPKGKGRPPKAPGTYPCEYCDLVATSSIDLTNHLNSHAGLKPHKCTKCPKGFTSKLDLKRHLESHLPLAQRATRFRCSTESCSQDFGSISQVMAHMKKPTSTCKLQQYKNVKQDGSFRYVGKNLPPVQSVDEQAPSDDTDKNESNNASAHSSDSDL